MHNPFVQIIPVSVNRWSVSQLLINSLRSENLVLPGLTWSYLVQVFLHSFSGNKNNKLRDNSFEERNKLS